MACWMRLSSFCMSLRSRRSSAPRGSSSSSTLGRFTRARAMATRCCWPPDRGDTGASQSPFRLTTSSISMTRSWISFSESLTF